MTVAATRSNLCDVMGCEAGLVNWALLMEHMLFHPDLRTETWTGSSMANGTPYDTIHGLSACVGTTTAH